MTDTNFPLTVDADFDDLPRTLRREKAARAARERQRRERDALGMEATFADAPSYLATARPDTPLRHREHAAAVVRRFDVPFFHLVVFFLKTVFAAIPALILLGVILYGAGRTLDAYYPGLMPMKIMVTVSQR